MERRLPWTAGRLAALVVLLWAPAAAANASTLRVGSVPLRPAGSRILGSLAPSSPVRLTVALAPRDPAALAA
ncbi:MAG TPA: hypothetical protein VG223_15345, partial [Solirubrobacteraceae bacterium]|nr:hypothetical protein [Solirubrobacteraceae bacterium]